MLNFDNSDTEEKGSELAQNIAQEIESSVVDDTAHATPKEEPVVIDPATQKYLYINPVDQAMKERLKKVVEELVVVRLDIFNKKVEIVTKRELIKEKIKFLNESKQIRIDKTEFEKTEKSAQDYIRLLDGIIHELSGEIGYYNVFASDEKPPVDKVVVPLKSPDKIEDYLELQMNGIRRYLKTVKRDINISFSRYTFGFDEQLKHLSFVESYVKASMKSKEAQEPVKESKEQ